MGLFDQFPYTNFHELNLDWILNALRVLEHTIDQFVAINALKYADPIQWNIIKQYEKNTIVIDPLTGTAYISVQPVPAGVALTNTDYWTVVFDLGAFVVRAAKNFTNSWESDTTNTATFSTNAGDWLIWGDTLYKALVNITAGDQYVVDSNIQHFTMEDIIGHLEDLSTTNKSSVVAAINEVAAQVLGKIGDLTDLDTTDKSNLVAAINEVLNDLITTNSNLRNKPYINVKDFGAVGDGVTNDYSSFMSAYNSADTGSTILIPYSNYLVDGTIPNDKNITWIMDKNTTIKGTAIGDPDNGAGKFICANLTNPWIIGTGTVEQSKIDKVTPRGGGVYMHISEMNTDDINSGYPKMITGTLTNGSSLITNVSDVSGIECAYGIIPDNIAGFPDGSTIGNTMRVISVIGDTIEMGKDRDNGVGSFTPYIWDGASGNYTFYIRKRAWNGIRYEGVTTSMDNNPDNWSWVYNSVLNLHNSPAFQMELDFNIWGTPSEKSRCLCLTGLGNSQADCTALEILRGGAANWSHAIEINNAQMGIDLSARDPLYIHTTYKNNVSGNWESANFGILFDNVTISATQNALFAGKQLDNGRRGILIQRATDNNPTGALIACINAAADTTMFEVRADGYTNLQSLYVSQDGVLLGANTVRGLQILNLSGNEAYKPIVAGKQLENGSGGIIIERATDNSPTGALIGCYNADGTVPIFEVNAAGMCTVAGLRIGSAVTDDATVTADGYFLIQDYQGNTVKLLVAR